MADVGYTLWSLQSWKDIDVHTARLYQDCAHHHYTNGITLIEKNINTTELYWFSSDNILGVDNFFVEKIDVLKQFVLYFKDKLYSDKTLFLAYNDGIVLPQIVFGHAKQNNERLLKQFRVKRYYFGHQLSRDYFTQREVDCMILIANGCQTKEIAKHLKISFRTVEAHLEHIKEKTQYRSLNESIFQS